MGTSAKACFCFVMALALLGCSAPKGITASVYDFGPGATDVQPRHRMASPPMLVLADVQGPLALEGAAVLYRLAYSDAQMLRPYAQARWSMPPALLLRHHLRSTLSAQRPVLHVNEGAPSPAGALVLRLELEEFSQLFDSPSTSRGLVRMRATLLQASPSGDMLLAQRTLAVSSPAPSPDAAGGVRALTTAVQVLTAQLDEWVQQTQAALPARN
nr:ABC-type transport auxiliary lipoprotein family protein [uncultured Rhodoferax sp.]